MSTEPINLTVESVLADLDSLVEEYGSEHVYENAAPVVGGPSCVYAVKVDGEFRPDCIVGHVLVRHGFPVEDLVYVKGEEGRYTTGGVSELLRKMGTSGLVTYSDGAATLLRVAQSKQDATYSWGESVEAAKRELNNEQ